ncbi:MAG: DUF86 domain-containing protein [Calditrichaeota bacterium]|nr:DUF86 domain-containing protein [Calditrichota bacterium]
MAVEDDRVFLWHILDAADAIHEYLSGLTRESFLRSRVVQDAVIRQLEVIGEATRHLSREFRSAHPAIPWSEIAGMRDKLIHDYFGVDLEVVWETASRDVPALREKLSGILGER